MPPENRKSAPDTTRRRPPRRGAGVLWAMVLTASVPHLAAPRDAAAQELTVWRNLFNERPARPEAPLADGAVVTLEAQRVTVAGASVLRIRSTRPDVHAVLQFVPARGGEGTLRLRLMLASRAGRYTYRAEQNSRIIRGGRFLPRRRYPLGADGTYTELRSAEGRVTELEIQDDALAELRLMRQGSVLELLAIAPQDGGNPSGGAHPFYFGESLAFADYDLLGAGWTGNGYGELWIARAAAAKVNAFVDGGDNAVLLRGVFTHALMRRRYWSVWLEGGGASYQALRNGVAKPARPEVTWAFGATGVYRINDWGIALNLATVNGPLLAQAFGGWQVFEQMALVLTVHRFQGFGDRGLGLAYDF